MSYLGQCIRLTLSLLGQSAPVRSAEDLRPPNERARPNPQVIPQHIVVPRTERARSRCLSFLFHNSMRTLAHVHLNTTSDAESNNNEVSLFALNDRSAGLSFQWVSGSRSL